jgi:hypothetical protein
MAVLNRKAENSEEMGQWGKGNGAEGNKSGDILAKDIVAEENDAQDRQA